MKKTIETIIYETNTRTLLNEVDASSSVYHTINSEQKIALFKNAQYFFAFNHHNFNNLSSFSQLKAMEENAKKFIEESKKIIEQDIDEPLSPIKIEAENEIVEATNTLNCFIQKINSAVTYSARCNRAIKKCFTKIGRVK